MKLRVQLGPNGRGSSLPSWATVEWVGRSGHPSSYGLLTGARSESARIAVVDGGARFREALAGRNDSVNWGLPQEYTAAIEAVLHAEPQQVVISQAAHGEIGSSPYVFACLTRLLCRILAAGLPVEDDEVWRLRDQCWTDQ